MRIIDKLAWIHIVDGRLLAARSRGKDAWFVPGGKREPGESDEQALVREVREELTVTLHSLRPAGVYEAPAHAQPDAIVRMTCFTAAFAGSLSPAAEIEEIAWLTHADRERMSAATRLVFDACIRPMQSIVDFVLEIDRLKAVTRKTHVPSAGRYENSAEHSWQIALLAQSLVQYAPEPVDIDRVVRMLLIHDLGEIDTGDTIVYAEHGWPERKAAELAAVTRMFGHLPDPQRTQLLALWNELEHGDTAESRFANAADRAMPVLLNLANHGQSWRENGISYERVVARVGPQVERGCPALWAYLAEKLAEANRQGWFRSAAAMPPL
jgi:putative hydrolases of HD superfamily